MTIHRFIRGALQARAYPSFDCEACHGMPEAPCECDIKGAVAPGVGPGWRKQFLRWFLRLSFWSKFPTS